jgi:hypothetical protein
VVDRPEFPVEVGGLLIRGIELAVLFDDLLLNVIDLLDDLQELQRTRLLGMGKHVGSIVGLDSRGQLLRNVRSPDEACDSREIERIALLVGKFSNLRLDEGVVLWVEIGVDDDRQFAVDLRFRQRSRLGRRLGSLAWLGLGGWLRGLGRFGWGRGRRRRGGGSTGRGQGDRGHNQAETQSGAAGQSATA